MKQKIISCNYFCRSKKIFLNFFPYEATPFKMADEMESCKMAKIFELFVDCSHQEQLHILETLPNLIRRDFIGELPLLVVAVILQHLPIKDIINCLRVCQKWNSVIKSCNTHWRHVCHRCGLTPPIINEYNDSSTSLMIIALSAERHILSMKQTIMEHKVVSNIELSSFDSTLKTYVHQDCYGRVVLNFSSWSYEEMAHYDGIDRSFVVFPTKSLQRIVWGSHIESNDIVYVTNSAEWVKFCCTNGKTRLWSDSQIVSSYTKLSACRKCGLIAEAEMQPLEENKSLILWKMEFILLNSHASSAQRIVRYAVMKDASIPVNGYTSIQSIALLSTSSFITEGSCCEHKLLIQLGGGVAAFSVSGNTFLDTKEASSSLEFINFYIPEGQAVLSCGSLGDNFRLSFDDKLLGLLFSDVLHVWNVESFKLLSVTNLRQYTGGTKCCLLAVGNLYSVVHSIDSNLRSHLHVVSSGSQFMLSFPLSRKEEMGLCGPVDQDWLNCLSTFNFIVFPLQNPFKSLVCDKQQIRTKFTAKIMSMMQS